MFGALLQATNPLVILDLFKEVGVSRRFSTLIEGEGLLNNGIAMALFNVFLALARDDDVQTHDVLTLFLQQAI